MSLTIRVRVVRVAYPRNGNVDNPTVQKAYDVYDGEKLIVSCARLREAKAEVRQLQENQ